MHAWAAVTLAAAILVVASGIAKWRAPAPTVIALRTAGLRSAGRDLVRALAAVEMGGGVAAVIMGSRATDTLLALLYLGFTAFLLRALRVPAGSCGCAGRDDVPASAAHLVMTVLFAIGASAAAVTGGAAGLARIASSGNPAAAAAALAAAGLVAWLGWIVLTVPVGPRRHPARP